MIMIIAGFLFLSVSTVFLPVETCDATGTTIYVDDNGGANYSSIQDAIDAASDGDTIFVYSGTYNENIVVNKTLTLTGENKDNTIINGVASGHVVEIKAYSVNLSGFTIQNPVGAEMKCVKMSQVQSCRIANNVIKKGNDGIYLFNSNENTISVNTILDNDANGIYLYLSVSNEIHGNKIENNNVNGIYLYSGSSSNEIYQNTIMGNNLYGLNLVSSNSNTIYLNDFSENGQSNAKDSGSNGWSYGMQGNYCRNLPFSRP